MDKIRWIKDKAATMRSWLNSLRQVADLRDAHAYGGLGMFGYGVHEVYPAAAWIACGLILFWLGVRR